MSNYTLGPWESHHSWDVTGYPCFYLHGMSGDQKRDEETLAANARLIAAAPDLLEVVRDYLESGFDVANTPLRQRARAALKKAVSRQ